MTSVQKRMEPRRSLLGASVDVTDARCLTPKISGPAVGPLHRIVDGLLHSGRHQCDSHWDAEAYTDANYLPKAARSLACNSSICLSNSEIRQSLLESGEHRACNDRDSQWTSEDSIAGNESASSGGVGILVIIEDVDGGNRIRRIPS